MTKKIFMMLGFCMILSGCASKKIEEVPKEEITTEFFESEKYEIETKQPIEEEMPKDIDVYDKKQQAEQEAIESLPEEPDWTKVDIEQYFKNSKIPSELMYKANDLGNDQIAMFQKDGKLKIARISEGRTLWSGSGFMNDPKVIDNVDTTLLKDYQIIVKCSEFTVIYYEETEELVCVRFSKEIGPRQKTPKEDVEKFMKYIFEDELYYGYLADKTLYYPILLREEENQISFHIYKVADNVSTKKFCNIFSTASKENLIVYHIFDDKLYIVKNAFMMRRTFWLNTDGKMGYINTYFTDDKIEVKEIEMSTQQLYDINILPREPISVNAMFRDMRLRGEYNSEKNMEEMIESRCFEENITKWDAYNCDSWKEAEPIINYSLEK